MAHCSPRSAAAQREALGVKTTLIVEDMSTNGRRHVAVQFPEAGRSGERAERPAEGDVASRSNGQQSGLQDFLVAVFA
jgi:hypothetical protein